MSQLIESQMLPGKHSENLLVDFLIPGICEGINTEQRMKYKIHVSNPRQAEHDNCSVWIIDGYVEAKVNMKDKVNKPSDTSSTSTNVQEDAGADTLIPEYGSVESPVPLVMIPRMDNRGLYNIFGKLYYIICRQRLAANVPFCSIESEDITQTKIECRIRSVNMETCESRDVALKRVKVLGGLMAVCIIIKSRKERPKPIPVMQYIASLCLRSVGLSESQITNSHLFSLAKMMGASDRVLSLIRLESEAESSTPAVTDLKYLLPGCVTKDGEHISINLGDNDTREFYAEAVVFLQMICKFLAVESGEEDVDDHDNYGCKTGDLPAVLIALTLRKAIRSKLRTNCSNDTFKLLHLCLYQVIRDSIIQNKWEVVEEHDTKLQLSRNAYGIPEHGLIHALREIVTYRTTVSSSGDQNDKYEVRQLNATQRGILCQLMTPDDDNAGLRQYAAMGCYVSMSTEPSHLVDIIAEKLEEIVESASEDIDVLEEYEMLTDQWKSAPNTLGMLQLSKVSPIIAKHEADKKVVWMHNYVPQGNYMLQSLVEVCKAIKTEYEEFSWNYTNAVFHTRYHYGRFMVRVGDVVYDSTELTYRRPDKQLQAYPYSQLPLEVPYMRYKPPARAILGAKMMSKCIGLPVVGEPQATQLRLMDPYKDLDYPRVTVGDNLASVPREECSTNIDAFRNYWFGRQSSIVTTNVAENKERGTHVLVAFMTYKGYGIEDGFVLNLESVKRGMFMVHEKIKIEWNKDRIAGGVLKTIKNIKVVAPYDRPVKHGDIILCVEYVNNKGETAYSYVKQEGLFELHMEDVYIIYNKREGHNVRITFDDIAKIEIVCSRNKPCYKGDKGAFCDGQKAVFVQIEDPNLLPTLKPTGNNPALDELLRKRNYKPDIIVNPLSVISRATMSFLYSTTVAMYCVLEGYDKAEEQINTSLTRLYKQESFVDVDHTQLPQYLCNATLSSGIEVEQPVAIGCGFCILPPHLADSKPRGLGAANINVVTGMPNKPSRDTPVRLSWQEFYSIIHSNSLSLIRDVYEDKERLYEYPYCTKCRSSVEVIDNECAVCASIIEDKVMLPKSIRMVQLAVQGMGCSINFGK